MNGLTGNRKLTILSTFTSEQELSRLRSGVKGHVLSSKTFDRELRKLTNKDASARAFAKALSLAKVPIEDAAKLDWCNYPMKGGLSLFETRERGSGVRLYGVLIGRTEDRKQVLVLVGAEDKDGTSKMNPAVKKRCERAARQLRQRWTELGGES